ncbi:MAG: hypothetical protein IKV59_09310, partial [Lachnospiraceae bacterium]|nr:hypothetical protein [Lachnospiraceae bacterium]
MKFPNINLKHIIRKGLAMTLAATMLCGVIPPLPAKAAAVTVNITDELVSNYNRYMQLFNYGNNVYNKRGERMVILSQIMHGQNNNIQEIPTDKKNSYQTDKVVWNPTQKDVDGHRDLYFLQWVNGTGYEHPGSGYEIVCSIAYVTTSGLIRYSENVDVDDYPRKLLGLSDYDQWNHSVVNQCYFAVPDDCAQILGIYFKNKSDSGNDNNEWYMDSLTISRITSDQVSDISVPFYNNPNYKECSFDNGKLVAFVSKEDLAAKYLNTFDVAQEWLYLLRTPDKDMDITTGYTYYAQI